MKFLVLFLLLGTALVQSKDLNTVIKNARTAIIKTMNDNIKMGPKYLRLSTTRIYLNVTANARSSHMFQFSTTALANATPA